MYLDITDYIMSHQVSLGNYYQPLMSLFILVIFIPIWGVYCLICTLLSVIENATKEDAPIIADYCHKSRFILEGLFNPCALPLYNWFVGSYLTSYEQYFFYTNSLSLTSHHPTIYAISVSICYLVWIHLVMRLIKFYQPTANYETVFLSPTINVSRIFGACALVIVIFDFNLTIDELLWNNVYIGCLIAITSFVYRLFYVMQYHINNLLR